MAAHAYGDNSVRLEGGWKVSYDAKGIKMRDSDSGFKSVLYERTVDGKKEYTYATGGTDGLDSKDWKNNVAQLIGFSKQYEQSKSSVKDIKKILGDAELTFVGHSLGGGLAEANSIITGDKAITFNAAGLSLLTKDNSRKSNTLAFVLTTDPLNFIQQSSVLLPDAGSRRQFVSPRSFRGYYNGHSIYSMLDSLRELKKGANLSIIEYISAELNR